MTDENRKSVVRLAIAADLALVATGIALFVSADPIALLALYIAAVTIAAAKGGWRAGALTIVLATTALLVLFKTSFDESHLIAFVVDAAIATAIMEAALPRRTARPVVHTHTEFGKLVAVPPVDAKEREREAAERHEVARALERAAAAQLQAQRESARDADGADITPLDPSRGKRNRSKRG